MPIWVIVLFLVGPRGIRSIPDESHLRATDFDDIES